MRSLHGRLDREVDRSRLEPVGLDGRALFRPDWAELGKRFAFGVAIAVAAALVGQRFGQRLGGVFLAFPAILPAAITFVEKQQGRGATTVDAMGAILGSVAMLAFALTATYTLRPLGPWLGVGAAWAAWLMVAVGLFSIVRAVIRRHR